MALTSITLIISIAVGFAVLNILLAIVWITCMRRSRDAKRQLAASRAHPPDLEKRPSVLKRIRRPSHTYPQPPPYRVRPEIRFDNAVTPLTHCEEPDYYLARDRFTPPPKLHAKKRRSTRGRKISPLVPADDKRRARANALPPATPPRHRDNPNNLAVPRSSVMRTTSKDTFDSASVYSTASAPLDMHDQVMLAQPFSRALYGRHVPEPQTGTTGAGPTLDMPAVPIATQASITAHPLDFIDPLAPQTYESVLARSRDHDRAELSRTDVGLPRRPQPVSTPEAPSRMRPRSHFRPTSRFSAMPPPLRLPELPTRNTPALDLDNSQRVLLSSPHSP